MARHGRLKDGVLSPAYVPATHVFAKTIEDVDARHKAAHEQRAFHAHARLLQLRFALSIFLRELDFGDGDEDLGPRLQIGRFEKRLFLRGTVG